MRFFSLFVLACCSSLASAADVPGSQDLPLVPRMADAQIVDYRPPAELERIYPMGAIRKISGQLRFDGQVTARGQMTSVTYELPPEHSATAAFTAAREALQKQGAELLFWCQARDCGERSLWANEVFGNAKLVGADGQQEYLLLRLAAPQDNSLVALYSITRGNRKAYLRQTIRCSGMERSVPTAALAAPARSTGHSIFRKLTAEDETGWLISRRLNLDTTLRSVFRSKGWAWRRQ
jgi:hypothetical protein